MSTAQHPDLLTPDQRRGLLAGLRIVREQQAKRDGCTFYTYYPDTGPLRRELYPKHMEFFAAGKLFKERLLMAANRVGKTEGCGAYETTCHLTGRYPRWWQGRRFSKPVEVWACGTTGETTRDIVQSKLLGPVDKPGFGMIPPGWIAHTSRRTHGLQGAIESARIKHSSGGYSLVNFKAYEQGRKSFEGTAKHVIWCDEEPPLDVYTEMLYRTLTTKGITFTTFTPLQGYSEMVRSFLELEDDLARETKIVIQAGWDDVPHLDEDEKKRLLATTPIYLRAARSKGEPTMGSGAIYPIPESDIVVPTRHIQDTWLKGYGLDVGWNRTAALFVAQHPGTGIYEAYDEHYMSVGEPSSHARGIRARGDWLRGVIDPAARGRQPHDGRQLLQSYRELGLNLEEADNSVEAGLLACFTLLIEGRFKVQAHLANFLAEYRKYHRDEKGHIVKTLDHLMDAFRYWVMSGQTRMTMRPTLTKAPRSSTRREGGRTWMGS